MSNYKITEHSKKKAKFYNVEIKPSENPKKKIDVYKDGKRIARIGDINYKDYGTYLQEGKKQYAEERRRLFLLRHKKDKNPYPGLILW